jgi:hypothetical protein
MICPNCNYERQEKDSIIPDWQCPNCGLAYAKVKANLDRCVLMRLISGREIKCSKIKLYDLKLVQELDRIRKAAAVNLAGHSTGLGFWGDIEWVAIGSLVTSVIDSSISNQMQKQAMNQLVQAANIAKQIRETAAFVKVSSIENIQFPDLGLWRAVRFEKQRKMDVVHIASDYVFVESEGKETAISWDKVEQYELI